MHSLEYLAVSDEIGDELGVQVDHYPIPDQIAIDLSKVRRLRPMKQLKNLLIGYDLWIQEVMGQELVKELSNFVKHDDDNNTFRTAKGPPTKLNLKKISYMTCRLAE